MPIWYRMDGPHYGRVAALSFWTKVRCRRGVGTNRIEAASEINLIDVLEIDVDRHHMHNLPRS